MFSFIQIVHLSFGNFHAELSVAVFNFVVLFLVYICFSFACFVEFWLFVCLFVRPSSSLYLVCLVCLSGAKVL